MMAVADAPELLTELPNEAARTSRGQVGLLTAPQVAEILGRHREWVHAHAALLGGFQLPDSGEWRFSPRGVVRGVFGGWDPTRSTEFRSESAPHRRPGSRRLAYPPAEHTLTNRPRQPRRGRGGASDAASKSRDD